MGRRYLHLLFTIFLSESVRAAAPDPYRDFRLPEFHTFEWNTAAQFNLAGQFNATNRNRTDRGTSLVVDLSPTAAWRSGSEARETVYSITSNLGWARNRQRFDAALSPNSILTRDDRARGGSQDVVLSGSWAWYLAASPWFVRPASRIEATFFQSVHTLDELDTFSTVVERSTSQDAFRAYRQRGDFTLALGWGRVRDVTGVFDASLLERRLLASGRLTRSLDPGSRRRLAELLTVRGPFSASHERPDKYFWRELEHLLAQDGALRDGAMDAYSLFRALEPVFRSSPFSRRRGFSVAATASLAETRGHDDSDFDQTRHTTVGGVPEPDVVFSESSRHSLDKEQFLAGIEYDCGRPFGERVQWDAYGWIRYGSGSERQISEQFSARLTWVVAERWYVSGGGFHSIASARAAGARLEPSWQASGFAMLGYWIENAWSADLWLTANQYDLRRTGAFPSAAYVRSNALLLGLHYRGAGYFRSPSLAIESRLQPANR